MATIGNLVANLSLQSASFTRGMKTAERSLSSSSTRMNKALIGVERRFDRMSKNAGRGLRRLNGVLLGLGAGFTLNAVIKQFSDFDSSMRRIVGLVGVAKTEVDGFRKSVLALSGRVGKGPAELAEALFFVTSAGLRGKKAMDVLELSAKAAAAGLGETKDVADALTSALNAYSSSGLTAAEATDVLVATVREGKLEASELSSAIGKILPIAEAAGVSFNELGASIAALTRIGLNTSEAVTGVRSVLIALSKESSKGRAELKKLGTSFAELRASVRDRGLLQTLIDLRERIGDNETAMQEIIGRAEGVTAVLALTGSQVDEVSGIFERMAVVAGALDTAFLAISSGIDQKLKLSVAGLNASMVRLGNVVAPLVIDGLDGMALTVKTLADGFDFLSESVGDVLAQFDLFVSKDFRINALKRQVGALNEELSSLPAATDNELVALTTRRNLLLKEIQQIRGEIAKLEQQAVAPVDQPGGAGRLRRRSSFVRSRRPPAAPNGQNHEQRSSSRRRPGRPPASAADHRSGFST